MHGFILLLSSIAHWKENQSVSNEILTGLDKIEAVFKEVSGQAPDWSRIQSLLEGFPNRKEILKSLMEDGEMLKEMPSRWARERREATALLSFIRTVLEFQVRKYPESKSEFNNYIKENMERALR
jgi:hypothetical protein